MSFMVGESDLCELFPFELAQRFLDSLRVIKDDSADLEVRHDFAIAPIAQSAR